MDVYTGSGTLFVRIIVQLFFLLKKVLFSTSCFQALTNKLKKGFALEFGFVKGHTVDLGSEEKDEATFVVADRHSSVFVPFSTMNCQDSYPQYRNR